MKIRKTAVVVCLLSIAAACDEDQKGKGRIGETEFYSEVCGRTLKSIRPITGEFTIDCSGMYSIYVLGNTESYSLLPVLQSEGTPKPVCSLYLREPLNNPVQDLQLHTVLAPGVTGVGTLNINFEGTEWHTQTGCMKFSHYEESTNTHPGKAVGEYEIIVSGGTDSIVFASVTGQLDWCEYGNRDDCPIEFNVGLTKQVSVNAPGGFVKYQVTDAFADGFGEATACRVLIDNTTGGVRVDMELGSWLGLPITQYGAFCWGAGVQKTPPRNYFLFESWGVTGPGTYGPSESCEVGPSFHWEVPRTWEGRMDFDMCTKIDVEHSTSWVDPTEDSVCTFSIEEDPGKFSLNCTETRWNTLVGPKPSDPDVVAKTFGDFHLEADCDVVYR